MARLRSRTLLAAGLLLGSFSLADSTVATTPPSTTPESGALEVLPPDESFAGATLGEWAAHWWQWATGLPAGFSCEDEQHGPVFFLPPAFENSFDCVVTEGTAIYFLWGGGFCSSATTEAFGRNEEELEACLDGQDMDLSTTEASVNGQQFAFDDYLATSPTFALNIPTDSVYDFSPGVALAMANMYAVIFAPPAPGAYVFKLIDESSEFNYTVNVSVEAPAIFIPDTEAPQATETPNVTETPATT